MRNIALILTAASILALQACTNGAITTGSSSSATSTESSVSTSISTVSSTEASVSSAESSVSSSWVSSSVSSSNPGNAVARGKALMESAMCSGCHTYNGDGTFSPIAIHLDHAESKAELAQEIDESMPLGNIDACDADCASDIAAYLWTLRTVRSSVSSVVASSSVATSSSRSSVVTTSSSRVSSSSSSSRAAKPATVADAKDAIKQVKDLANAMGKEADLLKKPAAILSGSEQLAYNAFVDGFKNSDVVSISADNKIAMGSDLTHIANALTKVLTATGIEFVGTIASGILKNETGIVIKTDQIQPEDEEAYPYWNFKLSDTVNACATDAPPCNVKVDLDLDLIGDATGTSGENVATLRIAEGYRINVKKLTASKGDISVGVKPGDAITFGKNFDVKINSKNGVMDTFNINSRNLNLNVPAWVRNSKTGYSVNATVNASSIFKLDLSLAKEAASDVAAEPMTIALNALSDTTKLLVQADVSNAAGDKLALNVAGGAKLVGEAPMVVKLGKPLDLGESATKYLGLDVTGDYAMIAGGKSMVSGVLVAGRTNNQDVKLDMLSLTRTAGDHEANGTYNIGTYDFGANLIETKSGVKVYVWQRAKVWGGNVVDGLGTRLGTIAQEDKNLVVTYTDGTKEAIFQVVK